MTTRFRTALLAAGAAFYFLKARRAQSRVERLAAAALESLLNAIDANDPVTGQHVRRVAAFALILADARGLGGRERSSVERVALFHDVGKIHEALFDITHDDHALSDAEREQVATHPLLGAEVVAPLSQFYPDLGDGVLSHHERWDGTGYPRQLRGLEIPLAARIVALADTFDAITHRRRYGTVRSQAEAALVIAAEREKQFDPELTDLFLSPAVQALIAAAMLQPPMALPVLGAANGRTRARAGVTNESDISNVPDVPDVAFRWRAGGA